ncbi:MAG: tetratricopeptide repeat protein [Planctomycetota bacterium]|jgi:tetratricopeptide (TPR) repeat protein
MCRFLLSGTRGVLWFVITGCLGLALAACDRETGPPPQPRPVPGTGEGSETKGEPAGEPVGPEEAKQRNLEATMQAELGEVYLKYGRFQEALQSYNKAIEVTKAFSENAVYHLGLAQAYRGLGNMKEAVRNLELAAVIFQKILPKAKDEQKDFYYEKISLIHKELGRRKEAIEWAEKIAGSGENVASIVKLARLYSLLGESPLAIDTYNMALKKVGDTPGALSVKLEYADYLAKSKNLGAARKIAEEVVAKAKNPQVRLGAKRLLVRIYDALGILDQVEMGAPKTPGSGEKGEKKEDKEGEKKE